MNIGEASRESGVSAKMIRYYEEIGLLRKAERSAGGYRRYTGADVDAIRFVRRARDLGFPTERIGALLALWRDGGRLSARVKALALDHVAALESKVAEITDMVETLRTLVGRCGGDARPDCPIIDDLAAGGVPGRSAVPESVTVRLPASRASRKSTGPARFGRAL